MADALWKLIPSVFHWFRTLQADPKDAKIEQKSVLVLIKNEKCENVDFLHPFPAKSLLLEFNGAEMALQSGLETIF